MASIAVQGPPQAPTLEEFQDMKIELVATKYQLSEVERKLEESDRQLTESIGMRDITARALGNSKVSLAYRVLYVSLVETYPGLLDGIATNIQVHIVRENAGWVGETPAGNFFQDLAEIGAILYDAGTFEEDKQTGEKKRMAKVNPIPDVFPYPESFNTRACEKRRSARKKANDRQDKLQAAYAMIQQCEQCGSIDIKYDLFPVCQSCSHVHAPTKGISAENITVTPPEDKFEDEWEAADHAFDSPKLPEEAQPKSKAKRLRRPTACTCGIRGRWIEGANGISHCKNCEMEYRSYKRD